MADDTSLPILRQRSTSTTRTIAEDARLRDAHPVRSLYIHVPFCLHKCHYCDFYSFVDRRDRQGAFTDRLCRELDALAPLAAGQTLHTIFVGGGTPTLLAAEHWRTLLGCLHGNFSIARDTSGQTEFTVECNPETADETLFGVLAEGGVNRLSIGAQSFDTRHLKALERHHEPASVGRALTLAGDAGIKRRSLDLIYAIPGQTTDECRVDLNEALTLPIDHISAYNLTYEPQTAMTARLASNDFVPADEDTELEMFHAARERCAAHGLRAYEISNFARPGFECRHNLAYWRQHDWLAAGPSASGHVAGHRYKVIPNLREYLKHDEDGFPQIIDHEPPDARRLLIERLMTGIRLAEGLDHPSITRSAAALDAETADRLHREIEGIAAEGYTTLTDGRLCLTDEGFPIADSIALRLMSAVG
ncbi:MAG: radical SAM family heme chaperone HemW [Planctomycetota bacterium]